MSWEIKSPTPSIAVSRSFDGKHAIAFNESSHRYKLDGKACVGVTTFGKGGWPTSQGLITWMREETAISLFENLTVPGNDGFYPREGFWPVSETVRKDLIATAKKVDRGTAQRAADIGTICHSYAELHSLGKVTEAETFMEQVRGIEAWPLINSCVTKYKEWAKTNQGVLVQAEALVASPTYNFCGKYDRLDRVNGKLRLRDYKTSKDIYSDQFIQLASYAIAIQEWNNLKVEELEVLRFGKEDGEFETMLISDPLEVMLFKEAALICRRVFEIKKKLDNDPRWKWYGANNGTIAKSV